MKITIQRLLSPRPACGPEMLIFNAHQPLTGQHHWQGEFHHGTHYAATHSADERVKDHIEENAGSDGWVCDYIAEDVIRTWAKEQVQRWDYKVENQPWQVWVDNWYREHGREEVNFDVVDFDEWLKTFIRNSTINAILKAARRPMPEIRESVELECTDGKWRRPTGIPSSVDVTGKKRLAGYVFVDHNGSTTYGKLEPSREALIDRHNKAQDADMAEFRAKLEEMNEVKLQSQAKYWLK